MKPYFMLSSGNRAVNMSLTFTGREIINIIRPYTYIYIYMHAYYGENKEENRLRK